MCTSPDQWVTASFAKQVIEVAGWIALRSLEGHTDRDNVGAGPRAVRGFKAASNRRVRWPLLLHDLPALDIESADGLPRPIAFPCDRLKSRQLQERSER